MEESFLKSKTGAWKACRCHAQLGLSRTSRRFTSVHPESRCLWDVSPGTWDSQSTFRYPLAPSPQAQNCTGTAVSYLPSHAVRFYIKIFWFQTSPWLFVSHRWAYPSWWGMPSEDWCSVPLNSKKRFLPWCIWGHQVKVQDMNSFLVLSDCEQLYFRCVRGLWGKRGNLVLWLNVHWS